MARDTDALVIMRPVNVRWDRGGVVEAILVLICAVRDINEPLCMRVPKVAMMRGAKMDLVLTQWRLDTVGEDTRREARDDLRHASQE